MDDDRHPVTVKVAAATVCTTLVCAVLRGADLVGLPSAVVSVDRYVNNVTGMLPPKLGLALAIVVIALPYGAWFVLQLRGTRSTRTLGIASVATVLAGGIGVLAISHTVDQFGSPGPRAFLHSLPVGPYAELLKTPPQVLGHTHRAEDAAPQKSEAPRRAHVATIGVADPAPGSGGCACSDVAASPPGAPPPASTVFASRTQSQSSSSSVTQGTGASEAESASSGSADGVVSESTSSSSSSGTGGGSASASGSASGTSSVEIEVVGR